MARILVIDDQESVRRLVGRTLAEGAHQVVEAGNGAEALGLLRQGFDLIVTDVMMPEMDGLELLRHLRAHNPSLPVLVMSGGWNNPRIDVLSVAQKLGADATLPKLEIRTRLLPMVEDMLAGRLRSAPH